MSFFNKKEEVMEVQLTQYGKYLLSKGKFEPVYYAFSDDEVLYDVSYGENAFETGKSSHKRIQNNTIRMRPLYEHEGAESRVTRLNNQITNAPEGDDDPDMLAKVLGDDLYGKDYVDDISITPDDRKLMRNLLGNSQTGNRYVPSWNIASKNSQRFETPIEVSASGPNIGYRRPQINMIVDYELEATTTPPEETIDIEEYQTQYGDENEIEFVDGYVLNVSKDKSYIILDIVEDNVPVSDDNFEVEFFLVDGEEEFIENGLKVVEEKLLALLLKESDVPQKNELATYVEIDFDSDVYDPMTKTYRDRDLGFRITDTAIPTGVLCDDD